MIGPTDTVAFDLGDTFVQLLDGGCAESIPVDEGFWERVGERFEARGGRLLGAFRITTDPAHWEMHPDGDEFLYLVSGRMDVILQEQGEERVVALRDGGACIVPRGTWHRQIVHGACEFVFVTPGRGTRTRPI